MDKEKKAQCPQLQVIGVISRWNKTRAKLKNKKQRTKVMTDR